MDALTSVMVFLASAVLSFSVCVLTGVIKRRREINKFTKAFTDAMELSEYAKSVADIRSISVEYRIGLLRTAAQAHESIKEKNYSFPKMVGVGGIKVATPGDKACYVCGGVHDPEWPHCFDSPYLRARMLAFNGRELTREDCCAHCEEEVRTMYLSAYGEEDDGQERADR